MASVASACETSASSQLCGAERAHSAIPLVQSKERHPHAAACAGGKGAGSTPDGAHGMKIVEARMLYVGGQGGIKLELCAA